MPVAEETMSISDVIIQLQDYSPTVRNNNILQSKIYSYKYFDSVHILLL